jgi:hypothetical protein
MVFTIKIDPLVLEAETTEQAKRLADEYFHSKRFEVRLSEIEEEGTDEW